jgi:hypothetical protein
MATYFPVAGSLSGTAPNPSIAGSGATAGAFPLLKATVGANGVITASSITPSSNAASTGTTTLTGAGSNAMTVMSGMTVTPVSSGTYFVSFNVVLQNNAAGATDTFSLQIFVNGAAQASTLYTFNPRSVNAILNYSVQGVVVYGGVGAIDIRWRQNTIANTVTATTRSLFVIQIG